MKLVLQAHKLQKALSTAREVVSKTLDPSIVLSQHVLLDFSEEDKVTFLAGDKELNHSVIITVEPEEGEFVNFPDSFVVERKGELVKQLSVSCNSFVDAISGLNGKTLVTLEFTKQPAYNELTYANLTYETTVVRIEASNGQGYALLQESLKDAVSISTLDISERVFRDIIQSTIFCVSIKASKHASLHTLILSLTPTQLKVFGGDYSRIALCSYPFKDEKPPYNIVGFRNFSEENPLTFNLSRRIGAELLRLLSNEEKLVRLFFHLTQSGHVQYLQVTRGDEELIFNLTYSKPPMYSHIIPEVFDNDVVCNAAEIKDKLNRSIKFGEIILINSADNVLTLSASNPGTLDSFSTEINSVKTNPNSQPLNLRIQGKHFIELINPLQESAKLRQYPVDQMMLSLNFVNKKVPVFVVKDLDNDELDRTYVLTPYNNVAAVDNQS
ncbi:hypothetical protein CKF54_04875 [Psittacicella hinzii]|uniref:DNA polymerase III subunit beta n=1 Tax=Psittacicella hinzii TaxID=2028575 RepID=A0A3A1Y8F5_9GAMM|nr:hypothetical protein [Psittacicella hinzii]RIY32397.1 hypothetical protein CKF54_04875 [Psittacicella hinzii]